MDSKARHMPVQNTIGRHHSFHGTRPPLPRAKPRIAASDSSSSGVLLGFLGAAAG